MKTLLILLFVISLALVSSCSNEQAVVMEKSSQNQKLSDDNVFKDYETVLDKAKGVEQTIIDSADARRKEMEKQDY